MTNVRKAIGVGAIALAAVAWVPSPSPGLVTHGSRDHRVVALTFDADMTRAMLADLRGGLVRTWYDARIVRELRTTRTPATVFVTGLWAQTYPAVVRSLAADPRFELENHSFDHAAWETPCYGLSGVASRDAKRSEVLRGASALLRVAEVKARYFRFPGGCQDEQDVRLVESLGEKPVQWDVVSGDSFLHDSSSIVSLVLKEVQPGSIVVMHLNGAPKAPATAAALERLIPELRARGFRFALLRTLLAR